MFTSRAVKISRCSFFARYSTVLFGLLIAAIAFLAPNKILAVSAHHPTAVSCNGTGVGTSIANPTTSNPAYITITQQYDPSESAQEQCAWSGFGGSGTAVSGDYVTLNFSIAPVNGQDCVTAISYGWFGYNPNYPGFYKSFESSETEATFAIPSGTNLSTLTLYGSVYTGGDSGDSGCEMGMDLKSISADF